MLTFQAVRDAAERIAPYVHRTPVVTNRSLDERAGCEVFLKCENLQRVGAFKFRGATNLILQLDDAEQVRGVITHSSGNHGQAVALAARTLGISATVVMPDTAPAVKRAAVEGYGARIVNCTAAQQSREEAVAALVSESGAVLVHPYNDERIVAGQGTAALELLEEVPDLDAVLAPVGGGGLLSGTTLTCVARGVRPIGCEPAGADDAYRSLTSGVRVTSQVPDTIADGLLTCLGELPFSILTAHEVPVTRVQESEIREALLFIWERTKLLIEPSSAVAIAPLLDRRLDLAGQRVGVVISGGNVDVRHLFG